jgi:tetratricopeptide (TPR) repeat protein
MSAFKIKSAWCSGTISRVACGLALGCLATCLGCQQDSQTVQTRPITGWEAPQESRVGAMRPRPEPKLLPGTHFASGRLLESGGDLAGAIQQYRLAIALNHDFVAAYEHLGQLLDRLGQYEAAERVWREAIARLPETASLRNDLGFHYLLQRRYSQAALYFDSALMVDPTYRRARINLGITLAQAGQADQALEQFRQALPEAHAQYNLGLVLRQNNRVREAADAFQAALQADPGLVAARVHLAQLEPVLDEINMRQARLAAAESEEVPETTTAADYSLDPDQGAQSSDSLRAPNAEDRSLVANGRLQEPAHAPDVSPPPSPADHPQPGLLPFLDEWTALYEDYANCLPKEWDLLTSEDPIDYSTAQAQPAPEQPGHDEVEVPASQTPALPVVQAPTERARTESAPATSLWRWLGRSVDLLSRPASPADSFNTERTRPGPMGFASPVTRQARARVDFEGMAVSAWGPASVGRLTRPEPSGAVTRNRLIGTVLPWNLSANLPDKPVAEQPESAKVGNRGTARVCGWLGQPDELDQLWCAAPGAQLIPRPIR